MAVAPLLLPLRAVVAVAAAVPWAVATSVTASRWETLTPPAPALSVLLWAVVVRLLPVVALGVAGAVEVPAGIPVVVEKSGPVVGAYGAVLRVAVVVVVVSGPLPPWVAETSATACRWVTPMPPVRGFLAPLLLHPPVAVAEAVVVLGVAGEAVEPDGIPAVAEKSDRMAATAGGARRAVAAGPPVAVEVVTSVMACR